MSNRSFGYSVQLFVQILLMGIALLLGVIVYAEVYARDYRWRGPFARREYYQLGESEMEVPLPAFLRQKVKDQSFADITLADYHVSAATAVSAVSPAGTASAADK